MSEALVVNAAPLIVFARVGRLGQRLAPGISVPEAVMTEIRPQHVPQPDVRTSNVEVKRPASVQEETGWRIPEAVRAS